MKTYFGKLHIPTTHWKLWPLVGFLAVSVVALGSIVVQFILIMIYGEDFLSHTSLLFTGEMFAKIIMIFFAILLIFIFAKGNKKEATGFTRNNFPKIILYGIVSALLFNIFVYGWEALIPGAKENLEGSLQKMGFGKTIIGDIAYILTITVLAPIGEEILFRAIAFRSMFSGLAKYKKIGITGAIFIASMVVSYLFGSVHLGEEQALYLIVPYFVFALVLTYIYVVTGSLYTAILSHSINNSFVILVALFTFTQLQPATNLVYILALFGPVISFGITYLLEKVFFGNPKKKFF